MKFKYLGHDVYYEVYGKGKPVVILNGIMMSTKSWIPFIEDFSANNQLILVDFLDQGQSDYLEGETYDHSIQVDLIKALCEELKLPKISVVGISYGGEVGLEFACRYPELCDRLVLFNTCAYTNVWLDDVGRGWELASESGRGDSYYFCSIPIIYSPTFYEARLDWMRNREKVLYPVFEDKVFIRRINRLSHSSTNYDVRPLLKDMHVPTLVIGAEQDFLTPLANQDYLVANLPNAYYVKLPGAGHASMYEKPMLFVTLSLGFINALSSEYKV